MTALTVAGVDLSLTSTGIARARFEAELMTSVVRRIESKGKAGASLRDRATRIERLVQTVFDETHDAGLVVVEGPSYGSARESSGSRHDRSGLWWRTVDAILADGRDVVEVPPSVRAKYATGAGNAGKDAVLAAAVKRYPLWDITGNDVADAVILAAMGARHLGHPIDSLPQLHLSAMTKVRWPATDPQGATA